MRFTNPVPESVRRVRTVQIDPQIFVEMCKDAARLHIFAVSYNPLPADACVVGAEYDALTDRWDLAVASDEFDIVPAGQHPPNHPLTVIHQVTVEPSDDYLEFNRPYSGSVMRIR